jgi:ferredoxin
MIVDYGYKDGSGEYFISIDTNKCNGCGACIPACPAQVFELKTEDPYDPFREEPVVVVKEEERKKINFTCSPCKPVSNRSPLPCMQACPSEAITHSW